MRAARVLSVVVVALLVGACGDGSPISNAEPSVDGLATPSPDGAATAAAGASVAASSAEPSLPIGLLAYDATDADVRAGTYATRTFRVPFTAEINTDLGIRDAGDTDPLVYIGQDKNAPLNWDEELSAMLLERVLDPTDQRSLRMMDGDLVDWFRRHPRMQPVAGSAKTFEVDGHAARQLDLLPTDLVPCPNFGDGDDCILIGYGPEGDEPFILFGGSRLRIVVVDHDGTPILFEYQSADDERYAARSAVFDHWVRSVHFGR